MLGDHNSNRAHTKRATACVISSTIAQKEARTLNGPRRVFCRRTDGHVKLVVEEHVLPGGFVLGGDREHLTLHM